MPGNRSIEELDMKTDSVVLFHRTRNNPSPSNVNAAAPPALLSLRVNTPGWKLQAGKKRRLAFLLNDRVGQFWEMVIFAALAICGLAGIVLSVLHVAAGH